MRFVFDNRAHNIVFRYGNRDCVVPFGKQQETTTAIIKEPGKYGPVIAAATAVRYFKDAPDRDVARKTALKKVLIEMGASREFRSAAWDAYHTRPGGRVSRQAEAKSDSVIHC